MRIAALAFLLVLCLVVPVRADEAEVLYERGKVLFRAGDLDGALGCFDRAVKANPKLALAWNARGVVYERTRRDRLALRDFGEAIRLDPRFVKALANRGRLLTRLRRYADAVPDLTTLVRLQMGDPEWRQMRCAAYLGAKKTAPALADAELLARRWPADADSHLYLAAALAAAGRWPDALRSAEQAIASEPDLPAAYSMRAAIFRKMGRKDAAKEDLRRARTLPPKPSALPDRLIPTG